MIPEAEPSALVDHWVRDAAAFADWIQRQVDASGGYWLHTPEYVEYPVERSGAIDVETAAEIEETRLILPDGFILDVEIAGVFRADQSFEYVSYGYHLAAPGKPLVWRYDKHRKPPFEEKHGTDCHIHRPGGRIEPTPFIGFDEVVLRAQGEIEAARAPQSVFQRLFRRKN